MLPNVIDVVTLPAYRLALQFSNGEKRAFDMRAYLDFPVYRALQDERLFAAAHVDYGTVVWSDAIDMAPETLYLESQAIAS